MDEQTTKRDLIRVCHLMYERSYVVSSDGNVSVRLEDDRILATPTMTCKGRMTEDLIAITDLEGRPLNDRRASSELAMHLLIYRERPDVKAVCHAHPPHGTAFAVRICCLPVYRNFERPHSGIVFAAPSELLHSEPRVKR